MKDFRIFLDMDGVVTNFIKRFKETPGSEGLSPNEYEAKHGKWSIWNVVRPHGIEWWSQMEWKPDGKELWEALNRDFEVRILSAPSRDNTSWMGKMEWIERELGIKQDSPTRKPESFEDSTKIIFNSKKYLFCGGPKDILIDDTPTKVMDWIRIGGGIGILHTDTESTLSKLKHITETIF